MDIDFTVHSYQEIDIEVAADFHGAPVVAKVPGIIVEMITDDGQTFTLSLIHI